jgi:hypothetical protein
MSSAPLRWPEGDAVLKHIFKLTNVRLVDQELPHKVANGYKISCCRRRVDGLLAAPGDMS